MKKYCLILVLFSCTASFAQVKTLNKRKLSNVKTVNTAGGSVQSANKTSNHTVSTVVQKASTTVQGSGLGPYQRKTFRLRKNGPAKE